MSEIFTSAKCVVVESKTITKQAYTVNGEKKDK